MLWSYDPYLGIVFIFRTVVSWPTIKGLHFSFWTILEVLPECASFLVTRFVNRIINHILHWFHKWMFSLGRSIAWFDHYPMTWELFGLKTVFRRQNAIIYSEKFSFMREHYLISKDYLYVNKWTMNRTANLALCAWPSCAKKWFLCMKSWQYIFVA